MIHRSEKKLKLHNFKLFACSITLHIRRVDRIKTHATINCQKSGRPAGRPVAGKVPRQPLCTERESIFVNAQS